MEARLSLLSATSSLGSSYPVTIAVQSGPATISGNTVTLTGVGTVVLKASQAGDAQHSPATATQSFQVTPAALTVTANNATRAYGAANPVFSGTIAGAMNGDTFTETFTTTATASSNPGTYPIVPAVTGTDLADYTITTVNGTLTVTAATTPTTAATTTKITAPSTAIYGSAVTLSAAVTSASGTPTGTVTFYTGTTSLGVGTLNGGVATLSTTCIACGHGQRHGSVCGIWELCRQYGIRGNGDGDFGCWRHRHYIECASERRIRHYIHSDGGS